MSRGIGKANAYRCAEQLLVHPASGCGFSAFRQNWWKPDWPLPGGIRRNPPFVHAAGQGGGEPIWWKVLGRLLAGENRTPDINRDGASSGMLNPKRHQVDCLRDAIGDTLFEIEKLAPERPSGRAVLAASLLIEKAISIDLHISVREQPNGLFLDRKSRSDYLHALTVDGDLYVDYRMSHADTFDDRYDNFVSAVLCFAEPFKADIERLAKP